MRIIGKYPVIKIGPKGERKVLSGNVYEGGFDNADGTAATSTSSAPTTDGNTPGWLAAAENVLNSGAAQNAVKIGGEIKAIKTGAATPSGATPPMGTGSGATAPGKPSEGMSSGAKVGIVVGVIGLAVVGYLIYKHNKKA